jgi:ABC-type multidrug transport system ATPase subunit
MQATVKEALMFSARLRLDGSVSEAQVREYVDEVIGIVELQPVQNKLVGMPKVSGLSVEQRKRLTIAVELVANPSVVFMDEPTSG